MLLLHQCELIQLLATSRSLKIAQIRRLLHIIEARKRQALVAAVIASCVRLLIIVRNRVLANLLAVSTRNALTIAIAAGIALVLAPATK
jgi:hypothetical protein